MHCVINVRFVQCAYSIWIWKWPMQCCAINICAMIIVVNIWLCSPWSRICIISIRGTLISFSPFSYLHFHSTCSWQLTRSFAMQHHCRSLKCHPTQKQLLSSVQLISSNHSPFKDADSLFSLRPSSTSMT